MIHSFSQSPHYLKFRDSVFKTTVKDKMTNLRRKLFTSFITKLSEQGRLSAKNEPWRDVFASPDDQMAFLNEALREEYRRGIALQGTG